MGCAASAAKPAPGSVAFEEPRADGVTGGGPSKGKTAGNDAMAKKVPKVARPQDLDKDEQAWLGNSIVKSAGFWATTGVLDADALRIPSMEVKLEKVGPLLPRSEMVRSICTNDLARELGLTPEQPLHEVFAGHCNWKDPMLKMFTTVVLTIQQLIDLSTTDQFNMSSYRWANAKPDSISSGRTVTIPSNYGWYLQHLAAEGTVGWMDFVSHKDEPGELVKAQP